MIRLPAVSAATGSAFASAGAGWGAASSSSSSASASASASAAGGGGAGAGDEAKAARRAANADRLRRMAEEKRNKTLAANTEQLRSYQALLDRR